MNAQRRRNRFAVEKRSFASQRSRSGNVGLEDATALRLTDLAHILNLQKLAFMPRVFADDEKALS